MSSGVELLISTLVGVISALITVFILQIWPSRYRWSEEISLRMGRESGRLVYSVKFYRPRRWFLKKRIKNPLDIRFRARVAVQGLVNPDRWTFVDIPMVKPWVPALDRMSVVHPVPQLCEPFQLRHFPQAIRRKHAERSLTLEDLLESGTDADLRVYAFAYRPYIGTQWMKRGRYRNRELQRTIKPGRFKRGSGYVDETADGTPPLMEDVIPLENYLPIIAEGK